MDALANFIIKRHAKIKDRPNWDSHWQEVTDHIIPRKNQVFSHRVTPGGEKRHYRVYDSTAINASKVLASALQGMLTNPSTQWFELTTGIPELDFNKNVKSWLQKTTRRMIQVLNNTNFQTQIHETYLDLATLGTACLKMEEDDEVIIKFEARPIYEHMCKENHKGLIDIVSRELKMDGRQIKGKFDLEKAAERLSPDEKIKLKKLEEDDFKDWNLIHYVGPLSEVDLKQVPKPAQRFPFISVYVIEELGISVHISGFEEFPYAVPRWDKTSGEIYGRGPGMDCLPDIKMINEMMKAIIKASQKAVDPPMQMPDDGIVLPLKLIPGGINYYRAGTADRIEPIQMLGRLEVTRDMVLDTRKAIREGFFVDQLQLLEEGPQMTATEVLQRTEEKLRLLGPVLGRLHFELLKPLIDRLFGIMSRRGELPAGIPQELKGLNLEVQFSSMIARAQRASEADNIQRVIGLMAPIIQAQPEIMDNIDGDGMLRFIGNVFSVPQEMFRSEDDRDQIRQGRAEAQQAMQQAELDKTNSEAVRNVGQLQAV